MSIHKVTPFYSDIKTFKKTWLAAVLPTMFQILILFRFGIKDLWRNKGGKLTRMITDND